MKSVRLFNEHAERWELPNGILHREDGPAFDDRHGNIQYRQNGVAHRLDGPAIFREDGSYDWVIDGRYITEQIEFWAETMGIDLDNLSEDDKILISIKWSRSENTNED